ncbi:MAG: hypothetical protein ABJC61_00265 [Acidobacteriota bacterium]
MARDLSAGEPRREIDYAVEFEEPTLLTLGACYAKTAGSREARTIRS